MNETVDVPIRADEVPFYAHPGDAGADLRSTDELVLAPGERASVGTGVSLALPDGHVGAAVQSHVHPDPPVPHLGRRAVR